MRKADLVAAVAAKTKMTQSAVDSVLTAALDTIMDSVAAGDKVTFTGFGSFEKRTRAARQGRNPQTGEVIEIAASNAPAFTPGKAFKDACGGPQQQS